jgi:hypothetical protein
MRCVRFARAALAVALVTIGSGVPRAAVALFQAECCIEQCDNESDGKSCAPDCTSASCVKVVPSAVAPPAATSGSVFDEDEGAVVAEAHRPVLPVVLGDLFHPPRG